MFTKQVSFSIVIFLLSSICLHVCALTISSPYGLKFFKTENAPWLSRLHVSSRDTPGSDGTLYGVTNVLCTAWEVDSFNNGTWKMCGKNAYKGTVPVWDGAGWSDAYSVLDRTIEPYNPSDPGYCFLAEGPDYDPDARDRATYIRYRFYSEEYASPPDTQRIWDEAPIEFRRSITNITVNANVKPSRLTSTNQASFYYTYDGFLERSLISNLAWRDPGPEDLKTTGHSVFPVDTRDIYSRRVQGKEKLNYIANILLEMAAYGWSYPTMLDYNWRYIWTEDAARGSLVCPEWTSRAFDGIYSGNMPDDIDWTKDGLYSLSNKIARLSGLAQSDSWGFGYDNRGYAYNTLFPYYFTFDVEGYPYPEPSENHTFDFPSLVASNFEFSIVAEITNRTQRLELKTQAAVNQALSELDRSMNLIGRINSVPGTSTYYSVSAEFSTGDVPLYSIMALKSNPPAWVAVDDAHFSFSMITSKVEESTSTWTSEYTDSVVVSENNPYASAGFWYTISGATYMDPDIIISELESGGFTTTDYAPPFVYVSGITPKNDAFSVSISGSDNILDSYGNRFEKNFDVYYHPSNPVARVYATVKDSYRFNESGIRGDFSDKNFQPSSNYWTDVDVCRDICTASIFSTDQITTNVQMHLKNIRRFRSSNDRDEINRVHSLEATNHHSKLFNILNTDYDFPIFNKKSYIDFRNNPYYYSEFLNSAVVKKGTYPITANSSSVMYLRCEGYRKWDVECGDIFISFGCPIDFTYNSSKLNIGKKRKIELYLYQYIHNIVDWVFRSLRVSDYY